MTSHIEDKLFKSMITLFTSNFFEFFIIKEFIKRSAPTEIVEIEPQRYYPDYVGETIEGNYVIVEFQSTPISKKDMRRFLTYNVLLHNKTKKDIGTYIICSPKIRNIKQIYKINEELLYKPQIISLKK